MSIVVEGVPDSLLVESTVLEIQEAMRVKGVINVVPARTLTNQMIVGTVGEYNFYIEPEDVAIPLVGQHNARKLVGRVIACRIVSTEGTMLKLSRRAVQEEYLSKLHELTPQESVLQGVATSAMEYGLFVDVGYGVCGLLPKRLLCYNVNRDLLSEIDLPMHLYVQIENFEEDGRLVLTQKKLLGSWHSNARRMLDIDTAIGVVRSIKDGIAYVELNPQLVGTLPATEGLKEQDVLSVIIKSINFKRKRIELGLEQVLDIPAPKTKFEYELK